MSLLHRAEVEANSIEPPLSQAVGYVVVIVIGFLIAFIMMFLTHILKKTVGEDNKTTEMFMTANRSVGTGLTSSAVISSWLWSTAMLGSTLVGYNFGVAGPFWFAAGCSPMIVFFALIGISCKLRVPEAHTLLEIVRIRYGTTGHIVWIVLCLINNIIAIANMLLGASAAITALTGIHIIAATFLLPAGVVLYTFVGGIKATFLTDYFHTFVITIIICFFTIKTFMVPEIGSPGGLYDLIVEVGKRHPVSGNEEGSFLTMTSKDAIYFGIIHVLANFGLVIMDTGFFAKAFSAAPQAVVPGYIVGGIAYFAIPWCLGTLMSFSALGLEDTPLFPTYPRRMSPVEVSNGLVLPYAAIAIADKGGAAAVLLITFMAVTSTISAQVISVSSIISFDIYRQYFNRSATDRDAIRWSHIGVVFFGLFSAAFSTALYYGSVDLGWTLYMLGVLTCPGIFPTVFTILWKKQSKLAAVASPLLGLATGIAVWLGSASALYGEITVASTGKSLPCMYGTVASALSPALYSVVISLIKPANYKWADFRNERLAFDQAETQHAPTAARSHVENLSNYAADKARLKHWGMLAAVWSAATFLGHWVLWPLPMYASRYVFGKGFFVAWVVVSIIWVWGTMLVAGFYPIIDGWKQLNLVYQGVKNSSKMESETNGTQSHDSDGSVLQTPKEVGTSAQSTYCDGLGRCFASAAGPGGIIFGFAIPETTTAPFQAIVQVTAPIEVGWAGIAFSSRMTNVPLIVTWPNGDTVKASPRVAFSYSLPGAYAEATLRVLDGSTVNETHWVSTIFCDGCSSWSDLAPSPPNSLDPAAPNPFGLAYSTAPVNDPEDENTGFSIHQSAQIGLVDLSLAQAAEFNDWVGEQPPAPTSVTPTASTTFVTSTIGSTPTASAPGGPLPIPTSCGLEGQFPLETAEGWSIVKIAGDLRTPRGMAVDKLGNLLIVHVGAGLSVHSFDSNGCIGTSKVLVERPQLTHGVVLSPDGKTVYISSATTVWRYSYDSASQTVSDETIVVRDMFPASHVTRTLVIPPATPNLLIVSLGSHTNLDGPSVIKETGRAIVKVFDISSPPSAGYDYNTEGHYLGYGLRNDIAIAVDNNNMVWSVENSADNFNRTVNGTSTVIVEDNPAEELNYLGDPSISNEQWYGYPTCFTVWGGEQFPDGNPVTGSQFIPAPNCTWTDARCEAESVRPRLALQAHSAPIDAKFDPEGENLYVTLHGSWNRDVPTGYKVVTIPFTTNAEGGYEPVAAQDSRDGYDDIVWDTQSDCNSSKCFRPSGLVWDLDHTRLFVASDNTRQGELYVLFKTA
ncbi:putative DUR3-Urea permease [Paramyrothecium foliicola]|nr:putative DUR3-Urea permease [Paramyrothecium foliicola]